ncbi:MAG: hypothetical protein ACRYG7_08765 [Janthinobacterium lividum]
MAKRANTSWACTIVLPVYDGAQPPVLHQVHLLSWQVGRQLALVEE